MYESYTTDFTSLGGKLYMVGYDDGVHVGKENGFKCNVIALNSEDLGIISRSYDEIHSAIQSGRKLVIPLTKYDGRFNNRKYIKLLEGWPWKDTYILVAKEENQFSHKVRCQATFNRHQWLRFAMIIKQRTSPIEFITKLLLQKRLKMEVHKIRNTVDRECEGLVVTGSSLTDETQRTLDWVHFDKAICKIRIGALLDDIIRIYKKTERYRTYFQLSALQYTECLYYFINTIGKFKDISGNTEDENFNNQVLELTKHLFATD